jgi:hypothetical protein
VTDTKCFRHGYEWEYDNGIYRANQARRVCLNTDRTFSKLNETPTIAGVQCA